MWCERCGVSGVKQPAGRAGCAWPRGPDDSFPAPGKAPGLLPAAPCGLDRVLGFPELGPGWEQSLLQPGGQRAVSGPRRSPLLGSGRSGPALPEISHFRDREFLLFIVKPKLPNDVKDGGYLSTM